MYKLAPMRVFNCDHCGHVVFFDSVQCLHCGSTLAFLPDSFTIAALVPVPEEGAGLWRRVDPRGDGLQSGRRYRMCRNHTTYQACNFALPAHHPGDLCVSCCQTRVLPDLSHAPNVRRWKQIEAAKRQLFYTLARLGLEPAPGGAGPVFEFLADVPGGPPILTGHLGGTITLNIAEADDDERARRRIALGEPYRTLIGHLRHESGHFYWDQLVRDGGRLESFREVFGDERQDYAAALQAHYARGTANADWAARHVSAYAAAHPWEDWAETWAHYLHLIDTLDTALSTGMAASEVDLITDPFGPQALWQERPDDAPDQDFLALMNGWVELTSILNELSRSMGQSDFYPFVLSAEAVRKLHFVHRFLMDHSQSLNATVGAPDSEQKSPGQAHPLSD